MPRGPHNRLETMVSARDYIANHPRIKVDALKDRYFKDQSAGGYRDIKFFLFLDAGGGRSLIGELQLNIQTALIGKELEHPVYEILRRAGFGAVPAPVTLGVSDVHHLGLAMRSVYIACKKSGVLSPTELLGLKEVVLSFFTKADTTKVRPLAITITGPRSWCSAR